MNVAEILDHINRARLLWSYDKDPGIGTHDLGCYKLEITEHKNRNVSYRRYLILYDEKPITMSRDWDRFNQHMREPVVQDRKTDSDMTKSSVEDKELREKIRLKCLNDWDIELDENQISMCIYEMEEQKLSLFHGQVWPNRRRYKKKNSEGKDDGWGIRITWDKSIDGYRALAHRSGAFAGSEKAEFSLDENNQLVATVTVYRRAKNGHKDKFVGEARFSEFVILVDEYVRGSKTGKRVPNSQWAASPYNQLSIAAERQALRKAFQECDDSIDVVIETASTSEPPESQVESSRGEPLSDERTGPVPDASYKESEQTRQAVDGSQGAKAESLTSQSKKEPVGKYVGIPQGGFKECAMYNKEERIVYIQGVAEGGIYLALDNGEVAEVNKDGYEIKRSTWEGTRGGRAWVIGDTYYDGTKVEKVAASKKDSAAFWLALDNGFKVMIDQYGKEIKRAERKKKESEEEKKETKEEANKEKPKKDNDEIDIESLNTIEEIRKHSTPLLARWCRDKNGGQKLSFKEAYLKLTGVVITPGMTMSADDHKVLYQCLEEALEGAG